MDAATLLPVTVKDTIQEFRPGDTVKVNVIIREGERSRAQTFQGAVIKGSFTNKKAPQVGYSFTVRRVSYGIGVERTFLIHSPLIDSLEVTRRGKVRQARLFYLRGLTGKKARIKERR